LDYLNDHAARPTEHLNISLDDNAVHFMFNCNEESSKKIMDK